MGLTTTQAPFIEQAQAAGERYIRQPYELYDDENHRAWRHLCSRMQPRWERYAIGDHLRGAERLEIDRENVPRLDDVSRLLKRDGGFVAQPVSGYIPAFAFFDCLSKRQFPTTVTVRHTGTLDYLPEPDIFHDVMGHVPLLAQPTFAEAMVRFGTCAHAAAQRVRGIADREQQLAMLQSIFRGLARFFWFTVEFGLMRSPEGIRAYGSGLLSSYGEIAHSVDSPLVQRYPFQIEWVVNQSFAIDRFQPLLFIIDSFEQLYDQSRELERWMESGKLDDVAPGEPSLSEEDVRSFLEVAVAK